MNKIKEILKEYKVYIIIILISLVVFNIKLPYYVLAPGGIIPIDDRIESGYNKKSDGSINLLYVTEYEGNISSILLASILKNWDIEKLEEIQLSNENHKEIHQRSKIMLDNSIQNAIFVAYKEAGKDIKINGKKNLVIGTTNDNGIEIGDEIISANNTLIEDIYTLKEIVSNTDVGSKITLKIKRDNKEMEIEVPVVIENNIKVLGVAMITNYDYELDPEIEIKFKDSEGGSSGGLMMAVSIYNSITEKDITKGLKIGGTGTIDIEGNVGEIDGVKYKIMGAVKNNIDLVFVPSGNYEEAIKTKKDNNYDIEIVSVNKFSDVINCLDNYEKGSFLNSAVK